MIKYITSFTLLTISAFATMINGISMTVDNEPITLYEIHKFKKQNKTTIPQAVNRLVQKKIEDIEIQKMNLVATPQEVDAKMQELAKQNNLTLEQFKQALVQEGLSEKKIRENIEEKFKRDKLYKKIIGAKIKKPDFDELKSYYDLHKKQFSMPSAVELIEYISATPDALELQKRQPMMKVPNIKVAPKTIKLDQVPSQIAGLLAQTPDGTFTPVLNLGKQSGMFFIKKKIGNTIASFDMAKRTVFDMLMKEKEQAVIIEYFEKKKSEAHVKIVRRP